MSQTNGHGHDEPGNGNSHDSHEHGHGDGDVIPESSLADWALKFLAGVALVGLLAVGIPWALSGQ